MPRCHAAILAALLLQGLTLCANLPTAAYRTPSSWSRHTKDIACELLETGSSPRMVETYRASDRLTLKYDDYMGLRVEKCVYSGEALARKTLYVYDGFKCVEELDGLAGNAVLMRHAWQPFDVGLDVIIATTDAAGASYFLHDANKNVMQRTDAEGNLTEKYEYAPFGGNTGEARAGVGFSSEAFDATTGLVYYNYRYYAHYYGKWPSRDPIEERGGIIIYSFLDNSPNNSYDSLGYGMITIAVEFSACFSKCFIEKSVYHLFDVFNPFSIRMAIESFCIDNSSLPKIDDISANFLNSSHSFSVDSVNCVKDCLASMVKYDGIEIPFINKIINIDYELSISGNNSSIKCDHTRRKVNYNFTVIPKYIIKLGEKKECNYTSRHAKTNFRYRW